MTEAEAKTKWCPFVRHQNGSGGTGVNRVNWDCSYDYANCIGSACMAWRETPAMMEVPPQGPMKETPSGGYCGLAGKASGP